jgi:hypothetical protein
LAVSFVDFFRHSFPGKAVVVTAIAAGIMSAQADSLKGWHQAIWIVILCGFAYMEIRSVDVDRMQRDKEQRETMNNQYLVEQAQRAGFQKTAKGIETTDQLLNDENANIVLLLKRPAGGAVITQSLGNLRERALALSQKILGRLFSFRTARIVTVDSPVLDSNIFRWCCLDEVRSIRDEFVDLHIRDRELDEHLSDIPDVRHKPPREVIPYYYMEEIAKRLTALAAEPQH